MDKPVTLYTKTWCPYCVMAKKLFEHRGIKFEEINVEQLSPEDVSKLFEKSGMRTVPQIFHGEDLIGGYTDLAARDAKDQLNFMK
jgi:glutaredoxin 3